MLTLLAALTVPFAAHAGTLTYQVDGKDFEGFYLKKSAKAPLVLIIHDWDGLTQYERDRAKSLHALGYSVFAADLFGKGVRPKETAEKRRLTGSLYENRGRMRALLNGALQSAAKQGLNTRNAVEIGYCFGGAAVLEHARSGADLKAFVTFHGGLSTPDGQDYSKVKGKVLVFHGSADESVTMKDFASLAAGLEKAGIDHEMVTYGGAPHAFTVKGSPRYRKDADEKSWKRFTAFLKTLTR